MVWGGVEVWWTSVAESPEPIGVTQLLEALWWLPGPDAVRNLPDQWASGNEHDGFGPIEVDALDSAGWVRLGLSPRQAVSAMRYRRAVGGFTDAKVLGRMRVLPGEWMEDHRERLVFPAEAKPERGHVEAQAASSGRNEVRRLLPAVESESDPRDRVDLNGVDSLTLLAIHGVGPWVAGRILGARRKWGGFADTSLLVEALGWDSLARALMPLFACDSSHIARRCPDSLTVEGWCALPGIRRREAAGIVRYVGHHGGRPEALLRCKVLDSARWNRILPYLECGSEGHP